MKTKSLVSLVLFLGLTACDPGTLSDKQDAKLQKMGQDLGLNEDEIRVAATLIKGFETEMGTSVVRSTELSHALCYAGSVKMPAEYERAHLLYLEYYVEADQDYYGWFRNKGVNDGASEKMGEIYLAAFKQCSSLGGRAKLLKKIKADRTPG